MATSALPLLLLLAVFAATTAAARPCKTLFYFSATTTTTYYPHDSAHSNPNPNPNFFPSGENPRYLTLVFTSTTTTRFPGRRSSLNFDVNPAFNGDSRLSSPAMASSDFPLKFYSTVSSSIRDRTKDIMSVVGALLFGVGCGALTAAIMYFMWALFSPGRFDYDDVSSSSSDDDDDDVAAAKRKLGYVAIPAQTEMVDDDIKKPAPPAKEVV